MRSNFERCTQWEKLNDFVFLVDKQTEEKVICKAETLRLRLTNFNVITEIKRSVRRDEEGRLHYDNFEHSYKIRGSANIIDNTITVFNNHRGLLLSNLDIISFIEINSIQGSHEGHSEMLANVERSASGDELSDDFLVGEPGSIKWNHHDGIICVLFIPVDMMNIILSGFKFIETISIKMAANVFILNNGDRRELGIFGVSGNSVSWQNRFGSFGARLDDINVEWTKKGHGKYS